MADTNSSPSLTTAEHTPGPWQARDHPQALFPFSIHDYLNDHTLAHVTDGFTGREKAAANAQLIAAAPDLLAVLLEFKSALGPAGNYTVTRKDKGEAWMPDAIYLGSLYQRADAAIAKATGENR
jgi:hypothetical protein